jgi:hypothetical protein
VTAPFFLESNKRKQLSAQISGKWSYLRLVAYDFFWLSKGGWCRCARGSMNQLQALAMNEANRWKKKLFSEQGRDLLEKLALAPWASRRRQEFCTLPLGKDHSECTWIRRRTALRLALIVCAKRRQGRFFGLRNSLQ